MRRREFLIGSAMTVGTVSTSRAQAVRQVCYCFLVFRTSTLINARRCSRIGSSRHIGHGWRQAIADRLQLAVID